MCALKALEGMHSHMSQPNFALSSLRDAPLVIWQTSVSAYFDLHHIELLLDLPLTRQCSDLDFHLASKTGAAGAGPGSSCMCLDAVVGACHDWARSQHGELLPIVPRVSGVLSGSADALRARNGLRTGSVRAFSASLPQFRAVSQVCIIEIRVATSGIDVQVAFFRTEAATRERVMESLSSVLTAELGHSNHAHSKRAMCAPLVLVLRDRSLLLQLGAAMDAFSGGGGASGAVCDDQTSESSRALASPAGGTGGLGGAEVPSLTFAASPKWRMRFGSRSTGEGEP